MENQCAIMSVLQQINEKFNPDERYGVREVLAKRLSHTHTVLQNAKVMSS